jgi:hypothetical protein
MMGRPSTILRKSDGVFFADDDMAAVCVCVWAERAWAVECTIANVGATQTRIEGDAAHDTCATPPLSSSHVSLSSAVKAWEYSRAGVAHVNC